MAIDSLLERFQPLFGRIAAEAPQRDRSRTLPHEAITWLKRAGFTALRVPIAYGGSGISLPELIELLVALSAADSNVTQALRAHFGFVEDRLNAHRDTDQSIWFHRFVDGEIVGGAWTEVGDVALGDVRTKVNRRDGVWELDGDKFYSTGALFADWLDVFARRTTDHGDVIAIVSRHQAGVILEDDWDGFGQVGTGSGSSHFRRACLEPENIIDFNDRFRYQTAFYQLFHVATLAGIGEAAQRDLSRLLRGRTRIYSHGNSTRASADAQLQQVAGEVTSHAWSARALAIRAALSAQRAYESHFSDDVPGEHAANVTAELESAKSQLVVSELILRATSRLFDALGASALSISNGLDRHWRNARAISSHNPLVYKARIIGDWAVNGTEPSYVWKIGQGYPQSERTSS